MPDYVRDWLVQDIKALSEKDFDDEKIYKFEYYLATTYKRYSL